MCRIAIALMHPDFNRQVKTSPSAIVNSELGFSLLHPFVEYLFSAEFISFLRREIISALDLPPLVERRGLKSAQYCPCGQKNAQLD